MAARCSLLASWLAFVVGCGSCGSGDLRVEGPHPYVRCGAVEPEERSWETGGLRFALEGRTLGIEGDVPQVLALALAPEADLEPLPAAPLRIVLGGIARDATSAERLLGQLAAAGPTLLLPGGEDDTEILDEALDAVDEPALVDLRGVHLVRFGGHEWVVVPGAPDGRYARGDRSCGFAPEDLEAIEPPDAEGPRHLLSWAAPSAAGALAAGFDGVPVGSDALGALGTRSAARGGLFAWPRTVAARTTGEGPEIWVSVPVWGRVVDGRDGSWSRGATAMISLGEGALTLAP